MLRRRYPSGWVDFHVNDDGRSYNDEVTSNRTLRPVSLILSRTAWYGWFPDFSHDVNLAVSAGDEVRVNITRFLLTSGMTTIGSLNTGLHTAQKVNSTYVLCGQNAEWIVEDFEDVNNNLVPFANFSAVHFTDVEATGPNGTYTADGSTIIYMQQNGQTLTSVSTNGTSITVTYV